MNKKILDTIKFLEELKGTINKNFTSIRFVKSLSSNSKGNTISYDYFILKDGIIVECARGYKDFKGCELINIEEAYKNDKFKMRSPFSYFEFI